VTQNSSLVQKGSDTLRPRARIIRAIGEDLISNPTIALVELIKNSYDADAYKVTVTFESPLVVGKGAIVVQDNGHGMTRSVLKSAWLEPATISKKNKHRSPGGRRVTGEKGLGRFAAARLAEKMHVESIALRPHRRVVADFDWGEFTKDKRFLDQIRCDWEEHRVDTQVVSGTVLRLEGLHDEWNVESLRRLRSELARLIARPRKKDSFEIDLNLPSAFKEHAGPITPPPILERPHYTLSGSLSGEGHLIATTSVEDGKATSVDEVVTLDKGSSPQCGPFEFEFKIWDRDREALNVLEAELRSTVPDLRRDLDEACGVSIYRDSFRVLPYGGPANDWLRLDLRRVQNPTMRLSNNQIVGAIHISADANPELRDQTNREGLVESPALDDLRQCVIVILTHLEKVRYQKRHEGVRKEERGGLGVFRDLDFRPVRDSFQQRYPKDREFLRFLTKQERTFRSSVKQVQQVIVRYRRLATLGQLIDVVLHDGRTPVASISNECDLARRDLKSTDLAELRRKLLARLDTIGKQTEVLSSLFRRIAPFGGRKRGRPVEQAIEKLITDAFAIFARSIAELKVQTTLSSGQTLVTADAAEMQQIIVNLLDNSLFWLGKVPSARRAIAVQCRRVDRGVEILFCDSGPGVPDDVRDYIFDPYYSTKPDGVGLGLTIAGEIATEYDGSLELVTPGLLSGANFRVLLRRRVSDSEEE
jgi:signal transduction histidine kinase